MYAIIDSLSVYVKLLLRYGEMSSIHGRKCSLKPSLMYSRPSNGKIYHDYIATRELARLVLVSLPSALLKIAILTMHQLVDLALCY